MVLDGNKTYNNNGAKHVWIHSDQNDQEKYHFGGVCRLIPNATATVLNHVSCKSIRKVLSVNVHRAQEGFIFIKNILQGSNNLFLYVATGFRNKLEPLIVLINKLFKGFVQI